MNKSLIIVLGISLIVIIAVVFALTKGQELYVNQQMRQEFDIPGRCSFGSEFECPEWNIDNSVNGVAAFFKLKNMYPEEVKINKIYCDFQVGSSEKSTSIKILPGKTNQLSCQYDGEFPYEDVEKVNVLLTYEYNGLIYELGGSIFD